MHQVFCSFMFRCRLLDPRKRFLFLFLFFFFFSPFLFSGQGHRKKAHVSGGRIAEPVVCKHPAISEIRPVIEHALHGEVPVREGDGRVDGLQGLLEHQRYRDMGRHEPGSIMPVIAVSRTPCSDEVPQETPTTGGRGGGKARANTRKRIREYVSRGTGNGGGGGLNKKKMRHEAIT